MIRVLLVDDEPLARDVLRARLASSSDVEIVGEAGDGPSAVRSIRRLQPDLVFLDVQMPQMNGFQVLEQLDPDELPVVIFVTAHDQYAIQAFERHALGYVLKPVTAARFDAALERARQECGRQRDLGSYHQLVELLAQARNRPLKEDRSGTVRRLTVQDGERFVVLDVDEIDHAEAQGNYVMLHSGKRHFLERMTLSSLEKRLDPENFARIHRSRIVNIRRVAALVPLAHGEFEVVLHDDTRLRMGRGYRHRLLPPS